MALQVKVHRRWPWQQDTFFSEEDIGVSISQGVLMITNGNEIRSYAPRFWRRVTSNAVPSRRI